MNFITLSSSNIDTEHICCAMSGKKNQAGIKAKKEWLCARMQEGLVFKKLDERGKVFIEYLPAEQAWVPIEAAGYLFINCHWVAGSFKGKGYGRRLLEFCEADARSMNGVVLISSAIKKPYLSDKAFFTRHGYLVCDSCEPGIELLAKRFNKEAALPAFRPCVHQGLGPGVKGIDIYYTAQCPFTLPYIEEIQSLAHADYPVRTHYISGRLQAQNHPAPVTTYSVFADGAFISNEILTPAKLKALIARQQSVPLVQD